MTSEEVFKDKDITDITVEISRMRDELEWKNQAQRERTQTQQLDYDRSGISNAPFELVGMLQDMIAQGNHQGMAISMNHESFLDFVDKRKYWDLASELSNKAQTSSESSLKKLLVKYRQWQLTRKVDSELQVNLDDATSLRQVQLQKFEIEDLRYKYEELDQILKVSHGKEEKLAVENRDFSIRLAQSSLAIREYKQDLQISKEETETVEEELKEVKGKS